MTHVETTAGPIADAEVTRAIHEALQAKRLRPSLHIVDTGYLDAALLVTSQQGHGVELLGPTRSDDKWQAQAGQGFDASHLTIDWAQEQAICPMGRPSLSWTPAVDRSNQAVIKIKFSMRDCQPCASRALCTRAARRTVRCGRRNNISACRQLGSVSRPPHIKRNMPSEPGLRGLSPKPCAPLVSDVPAIGVQRKPISNTSSRLRRSILFEWARG